MIVDAAVYHQGRRLETGESSLAEIGRAVAAHDGAFGWVGMRMPSAEELGEVCAAIGGPHLAFDEVVAPHKRPVLAIENEAVQLVIRTANFDARSRAARLGELTVILNDNALVTVRFGGASPLGELRHRIEDQAEWLALGPSAVMASVITEVIESYRPVLDRFEEEVVDVERDVFDVRLRRPVRRLYQLKRDIRTLILAVAALEEPLARLVRRAEGTMPEPVVTMLQEADEQLARVVARAESLSDLLDAALDAAMAQIAVQQNDDMRKISAWVAIAVGPTLIAGIYGMNFENMPELTWPFAYPSALILMTLLSLFLYRAFRRTGWL
ncbi:MAG: CorA family divalent cation transporter [Acidimicrobiales bacterium]